MASDSVETMLARLEGKVDALRAEVSGQVNEMRAAMAAGDRQNETAITYVRADVARIEQELTQFKGETRGEFEDRDERIDKNRRLVWTTLAAPLLVAVVGALLLFSLGLGK